MYIGAWACTGAIGSCEKASQNRFPGEFSAQVRMLLLPTAPAGQPPAGMRAPGNYEGLMALAATVKG
jgi:hypothetical protein